jgi:Bacterial Ig domain
MIKVLAAGILISMLTLTVLSNVFAKQLIDCSSYHDGFKDGTQQGETDLQDGSSFNPACNPNGLHTSDGPRTTVYCKGWSDGYKFVYKGGGSSGISAEKQQCSTQQNVSNDGRTIVASNNVPMINITSPANNATVPHGNISVQGTASDNLRTGGIRNVLVRIDSGATVLPYAMASPSSPGNWSKWSITLNIPTTGTERIQARVTDNAGNQSWNSVTVTIT